jgi:hypothetical protein
LPLANITTWNTKVPILNTWAFVGDKEKLRQEIENFHSGVSSQCAHEAEGMGP